MRLTDGTSFPHHYALGKANNYTEKIANAIAKEMKSIGIHWNLAPVCDINSNPKNPVINIRSFGEDKNIVSKNVVDYINGLHKENIISCAKHFPGHGDTETDSHTAFPVITKSLQELEQNEMIPFVEAIKSGVKSIMLGHLIVKSISELPMSLSNEAVKYLRNKLNFNGLILTDALDMQAITDTYGDDAPLLAFKAGVDIILMPENPMLVIEQITNL
jgi:beta-glucosidase-like glycosyl hydrolase